MFQLFSTPGWFSGWDIVFDAIGLIIALLIALYSWRIYRLSTENKFAYFSLAFILISLASFFKILTQALVYYTPVRTAAMNVLIPVVGRTVAGTNYSQLFFRSGFFLWMVAMLGAWLLIFFISQKKRDRLRKYYEVSQIALFVYLLVLIAVVSNFKYFVFYTTSTVILGMTVLNYYKNYLNTERNKNAFLVLCSFTLILTGHVFFVFVFLFEQFYVAGELFLLAGFLLLLYAYKNITGRR